MRLVSRQIIRLRAERAEHRLPMVRMASCKQEETRACMCEHMHMSTHAALVHEHAQAAAAEPPTRELERWSTIEELPADVVL